MKVTDAKRTKIALLSGWTILFIYFLLINSCAATQKAGIRRVAESRLESCLDGCPPTFPLCRKACIQESVQYCRDQGLEKTCGIDGWYTNDNRNQSLWGARHW